jgi:hypothetical protein
MSCSCRGTRVAVPFRFCVLGCRLQWPGLKRFGGSICAMSQSHSVKRHITFGAPRYSTMPQESNQPRTRVRNKAPNRSSKENPPSNYPEGGASTSATRVGIAPSNALPRPERYAVSTPRKRPHGRLEPPKRTKLDTAVHELNTAAAKLGRMLPENFKRDGEIGSIRGYADLHTLAESLASVMETMMDERSIEELKKPAATTLIKSWIKKALPFIEQGLTAATVFVYNDFFANYEEHYSSSLWFNSLSSFIYCASPSSIAGSFLTFSKYKSKQRWQTK